MNSEMKNSIDTVAPSLTQKIVNAENFGKLPSTRARDAHLDELLFVRDAALTLGAHFPVDGEGDARAVTRCSCGKEFTKDGPDTYGTHITDEFIAVSASLKVR